MRLFSLGFDEYTVLFAPSVNADVFPAIAVRLNSIDSIDSGILIIRISPEET